MQALARIRSEIEESIQRGKEIREYLQRSSIENYEEHIQQVSLLSADIERLKIQLEYAQKQFADNQEAIDKLRKTLEQTRKTLEAELKKQSVSALSDRMMLLVEELQEQQYQKLLRSVEADLNEKFQQLIRKEGFVDHIYGISGDFPLRKNLRWGQNWGQNLYTAYTSALLLQ